MSWPTDSSGYSLAERIGNGSFSAVWRAQVVGTSEEGGLPAQVAVKIMDLENISTSFDDILQEVQTMRLCDDKNVLRCYCSFVHESQLWLVTQYMDKGSCLRVMTIASEVLGLGRGMSEDGVAYILRESLQGLHYLHSNGQIHRDIKCGNILLDSEGGVRLADFGVSGWTLSGGQRHETVRTFVGTPCWMAPEVMEQVDGYDHRADIWSLGITALELAKGMAPYAKYAPMRVLVLTIEEDPPSLKSYENDRQPNGTAFSRSFEEFYKKCLQKNPRARPSAEELLKLKFFKNREKTALVTQYLDKIPSVKEELKDCTPPELEDFPDDTELSAPKADAAPATEETAHDTCTAFKSDHVFNPAVTNAVASVMQGENFDNSATLQTNPLATEKKAVEPSAGKAEYAAGTTWVFDDFSTVGGELVVGNKEATAVKMDQNGPDHEVDGEALDSFMEDMEGVVDIS